MENNHIMFFVNICAVEQETLSKQDLKVPYVSNSFVELKTAEKRKSNGSSASSKGNNWSLADMLTFLNKMDHKRVSTSNIEADEVQSPQFDGELSNREVC